MVAIVSIPSKIYGDYIQPNSFIFEYSSSLTIVDDGEGNLNRLLVLPLKQLQHQLFL
jgi:hypothetical protein